MDAKAAVKIGCFSRGGKSRLERKAWDLRRPRIGGFLAG
jgi:hypothetical protein